MSKIADRDIRRYSIAEVSDETGVPVALLRRWEARFPQLKPKRDRANRRYFLREDIEIVRRIKVLIEHEKLTSAGVRKRLAQELRGEGRPASNREALDILHRIETQVQEMLDLLSD